MAPHRAACTRACERTPDWQKKRLAFEAWSRAKKEFSGNDLPSVATIQRSMVEILDAGSG
jgi:hypothetical protein